MSDSSRPDIAGEPLPEGPLRQRDAISLRSQLAIALVVAAAVPLIVAALLSTLGATTEAVDAALTEQETLAGALAASVDD